VKITAARCNINIRDPKCWFDFNKLLREYTLNMSDGFERAISIYLVHLIAGHPTYLFSQLDFDIVPFPPKQPPVEENNDTKNNEKASEKSKKKGKGKIKDSKGDSNAKDRPTSATAKKGGGNNVASVKKSNTCRPIDLVQALDKERAFYLEDKEKDIISNLEHMMRAAADIQSAIRLFQEADSDDSGSLDHEEIRVLMERLGLIMSLKRLTNLIAKFDIDQGGKIELPEFLMLLKEQRVEAKQRIDDIRNVPIMAWKHNPDMRYVPPEKGYLQITVMDGFAKKKHYRILTATQREIIEEMAHDVGVANVSSMFGSSGLNGTKLRLDEALTIAETIINETQDRVRAIKELITQMNSADEARQLLHTILQDSDNYRAEMLRLKREMGNALRAILGNPNGYYVLDLAKPMDRMCLEKLLEISSTLAVKHAEESKVGYGRTGDTSQKGNGSSFRNEMFQRHEITMSPQFASPLPIHGMLEFDFSGTFHAPRDALILSDARVVKTLLMHGLIDPHDVGIALNYLREMKIAYDETLSCDGTTVYECSMDRARLIGEHCEQFYAMIDHRSKQYLESTEKESLTPTTDPKSGQLVDCFERDTKYPLHLSIHDYYMRKEAKDKEIADKLAAERATLNAKAMAMANRYAIYRNPALMQSALARIQVDTDSDSDDGTGMDTNTLSDSLVHNERYFYFLLN